MPPCCPNPCRAHKKRRARACLFLKAGNNTNGRQWRHRNPPRPFQCIESHRPSKYGGSRHARGATEPRTSPVALQDGRNDVSRRSCLTFKTRKEASPASRRICALQRAALGQVRRARKAGEITDRRSRSGLDSACANGGVGRRASRSWPPSDPCRIRKRPVAA